VFLSLLETLKGGNLGGGKEERKRREKGEDREVVMKACDKDLLFQRRDPNQESRGSVSHGNPVWRQRTHY